MVGCGGAGGRGEVVEGVVCHWVGEEGAGEEGVDFGGLGWGEGGVFFEGDLWFGWGGGCRCALG